MRTGAERDGGGGGGVSGAGFIQYLLTLVLLEPNISIRFQAYFRSIDVSINFIKQFFVDAQFIMLIQ